MPPRPYNLVPRWPGAPGCHIVGKSAGEAQVRWRMWTAARRHRTVRASSRAIRWEEVVAEDPSELTSGTPRRRLGNFRTPELAARVREVLAEAGIPSSGLPDPGRPERWGRWVDWLVIIGAGYVLMFRALGVGPLRQTFILSGSSLFTLGFAVPKDLPTTALAFSEATFGIGMIALLLSYLPSMYTSFSRREAAVAGLDVRAGSPPSAAELLIRYSRIEGLDRLDELWQTWETWFTDIEETHTSIPAIVFFRSPDPVRSWVTAAGAVLDAASITASTLDRPRPVEAQLCIRAGYIALRKIADFFGVPFHPDPHWPDQAISIDKSEFEEVYDQLKQEDVPVKPDRDQAWRDFAGWRVNYDSVVLALAALTVAPPAKWSSDRSLISPPLAPILHRRRSRL